jgi:vitamin B12 transporter
MTSTLAGIVATARVRAASLRLITESLRRFRANEAGNTPRISRRPIVFLVILLAFAGPSGGGVLSAQQDVFELEGLVISASPTPREAESVANHVTVLSGEDLRIAGTRSLADALRLVSGVGVVRNGSFGAVTSIFLRGGESDYTLVLVDGVQVNQAGGGFDFAGLTTDNVERVEIVRGPSSALYGSDAVAGVIHVITRTGRGAPRVNLSFDGGSFGRRDWLADFMAGTERAGYSVSLAHQSSDGVLDFNNGQMNTVLSGSARLRPDDLTQLSVSLRVSDREYHFPTDGSGAVVDRNALTFSGGTVAQVSATRVVTDHISIQALVGLNETDGGTDDAQDSPSDTLGFYGFTSLDHFRRTSGELRGHLTLGEAVVTAGVELEEERQRSFTESLSSFGPSYGRSENERGNQAYFLHLSGGAGALSFNAGGRLENNQRFGQQVAWQAGASWAGSATGTVLRASVGRAIKEPTFFENFATGFAVGNPDLNPERSFSWEVGVEQALVDEAVSFRATFFDQSFEDLIQYTFAPPTPGDPNFFNVAGAISKGIELDVSGEAGALSGGAAWTWLETEVVDSGFDQGVGATFVEGERLLRRPAHTLSLRGTVAAGAASLSVNLALVGDRSDRDFTSFPATPVSLPGYRLMSLGGEWAMQNGSEGSPRLTLVLRVENVLDAVYEEVLGFRAPGRGIYVGGRVGLGR